MISTKHRNCSKCLRPLDLEDFPVKRDSKGGRGTVCKQCLSDAAATWNKANREKRNKRRRKFGRVASWF